MTKQAQPTNSATTTALTATAIGFLVWHQLRDVPVEPAELDKALTDKGFDPDEWGSKPRSRVQVFSESIKRLVGRTYDALDGRSQATRCMFPLSLPDSDDGFRLRSVHVAKGDKASKKNALAQVGIIAFNLKTEEVSWSFTALERRTAGSQVETDEKYVERFKALVESAKKAATAGQAKMMGQMSLSQLTDSDVNAFVQSAADVAAYVDKFGDKIDRRFMHFVIRDALYRKDMHAIPLRPSGGIYFLPHNGQADSPAETFQRFARVIMEVCPADTIHMMPQFPEPGTVSAVAESAQVSLSGKVSEVMYQLKDLESIDRISMVASKTETINSVLATAKLYRDLVGMKADELDDQISKVRERITALTEGLDKQKEANASARKVSRKSIKSQLAEAEAERAQLLARIAELEAAAQAKPRSTDEQIAGTKASNEAASKAQNAVDQDGLQLLKLTDENIRAACKQAKDASGTETVLGDLTIEHSDTGYSWEIGTKAGECKRVIDVVRQVKKAVEA